ncbi:uncharacterized protein LOC129592336 [Paramacrobiotus metropolitanus]|uniref:uncharacterized protein LOC129592336 n=1 Tax=Paramacrobiotus metropolitanus TaxID=2943436 RepID=UPI0024461C30|nr:uncharacterized protein LOC129592336 [Paramacrobiotus metropolitanus]
MVAYIIIVAYSIYIGASLFVYVCICGGAHTVVTTMQYQNLVFWSALLLGNFPRPVDTELQTFSGAKGAFHPRCDAGMYVASAAAVMEERSGIIVHHLVSHTWQAKEQGLQGRSSEKCFRR